MTADLLATSEVRKCRLCGYVGLDVSPALYQKRDGKWTTIRKCDDHAACESRRPTRA